MHPLILQQLAAERVSYMIAQAENWHRAHQARVARWSQLSRSLADIGRFSASTENLAGQAGPLRPSAGCGQARELVVAERANGQA